MPCRRPRQSEPMKALVVYYSRTGRTRLLAQKIASALHATVEELVAVTDHQGVGGYLRAAVEGRFQHAAPLIPPQHDPDRFDLVVIGTPIWAGGVSSPVRSYLRQHVPALRRVAFFCTMMQRGCETAFRQMQQIAVRVPLARLAVTDHQLAQMTADDSVDEAVRAFARTAGNAARHPAPSRMEFELLQIR